MLAESYIKVIGQFLFLFIGFLLPYFHLSRWKRLSAEEALAASFGASSLLFGAVAFVTHVFGLHQKTAHCLALLVLALSVLPNLRHGFERLKREPFPLSFGLFSVFLLLIMMLEAASPIYIGGFWYFDWWQHYSLSQMYMGGFPRDYLWLGMYNFASRTPLLNLNSAFFLSMVGKNFWTFQIVASILNSVFVLPVYLLCRRLSGERTAVMVGALLFLSPSILHNTWYPWPKLFAAYFVVLAAYFYLKWKQDSHIPDSIGCIIVFVFVWAGFLAHQSSLFSSMIILLDLFLRALWKEPKRLLFLVLACVFCFIIICGTWFGWAASFFGITGTFLSYYERPATVGGPSGYLILFTYHTLATICSPLFLYDIFGKQFDILVFFENLQVLYYNSFVGMATITVCASAMVVLTMRIGIGGARAGYIRHVSGITIRCLLLLGGAWCLVLSILVYQSAGFGSTLFSHYFNHPQFARAMFGAFFLAGAFAMTAAGVVLWLLARSNTNNLRDISTDSAGSLVLWMAFAGYAGGIATHHELYIHGMVSAGSATAVLLTVLFLARVCSDVSRIKRLFLAALIFCENFLITWFPLLIIKHDWGWAGEKNWQLKEQHSLVFMADLFESQWWIFAIAGIAIQITMLLVWSLGKRGGEVEGDSGTKA